jgi:hypothetical protein
MHEIRTNKTSVIQDSISQKKADPYNERQTVDVDVDVEYNPKKPNKTSQYGTF